MGYANALAVIAAMGALISFGLGLGATRAVRIAYLAAIPVFVVPLYLTYSRGGWLALAVGLLAMLAVRLPALDRRIAVPLAAGVALAAAVAVIAVARGFDSSTTTPSSGASRLTTVSGSNRAEYWGVAWRGVENHPIVGSGAGSWGRYWVRERPVPQPARDAHSLFLETLAELGPLGLAFIVAVFAAPFVAAVRTRGDRLTAAALGPFAAYTAHAAQDWDWEVPAATVPAIVCAVALLVADRRPPGQPLRLRTAGAVVAGVLAALTLAAYAGNRALEVAETGSDASARRAARLQPWSAQPWRVLGEAQLAAGEAERARETFLDALDRDDGDWELWLDLALASEGAERERALARAHELNPLEPAIGELRGELTREAVPPGPGQRLLLLLFFGFLQAPILSPWRTWRFSFVSPLTRTVAFLPFFALWQTAKGALAHEPSLSPCRRCALTALRATRIVLYGFFRDFVRWQIVTLPPYCSVAAGVPEGDTAAPTDASAANASAITPPARAARNGSRAITALIGSRDLLGRPSLGGARVLAPAARSETSADYVVLPRASTRQRPTTSPFCTATSSS